MSEEQLIKHRETTEWQRFCREKIVKIEKVWNRKLDEPADNDTD